ncbi:MAG: hypothetical protein EPN61_01575 [Burkholderiaceae bacterium]|nr:MAG: hypothetical protein EPN61_01575 [Burkholderiaceae bacterium]
MTTFTESDEAYRTAIEAPGRELSSAFTSARSVAQIDLNGTDLTLAVLLRLKSFQLTQQRIKNELNKIYAAPAADFFVETVCFFLKVVLERLDSSLTVASERNIVKRQGSMRPDISVWRGDKVVAAIECKTQLGWNRGGWLSEFEDREARLLADHPLARLFLVVMTGQNWQGFGDDKRIRKQFFVLLNDIGLDKFEESGEADNIVHAIEGLFREVLSHAGSKPLA